MFTLILSSLILSAEPNQPTEVIGSAAQPDGTRHNITVFQSNNLENPFGYIAPEPYIPPQIINGQPSLPAESAIATQTAPIQLITQTSTTNPQQMNQNPLYYQNKIKNTIYQSGNRLIDIQAVPIKDINTALTPNIQPTVSDYPIW